MDCTYGIKFLRSLLLRFLWGNQLLIQVSNIVIIVLQVCNSLLSTLILVALELK
jgi:hypothetical protein